MFVACDGPNPIRPDEAAKVKATRELIEREIDWPCTIERRYSEVNQGCRIGVSNAITWFFEQVEEGIILEDDCIPHVDFFRYCSDLLEHYRNDTRIFSICGSNFQQGQLRGDASYYFSIHSDSWGWASWRRAWQFYAEAENNWISFRDSSAMSDVFSISAEKEYWINILDKLFVQHNSDSWAYQWLLVCWMNNGLSIWPNTNLVTNAGFQMADATHTQGESEFGEMPTSALGVISHPQFIIPNRQADAYAFYQRRSGRLYILRNRLGKFYNIYRFLEVTLAEGPKKATLKALLYLENLFKFSIVRN
jgi:hypothetical protein